jgi:hypothetical protein
VGLEALTADVCSGSMFSRVLPKSLPQSVVAPWRAVLTVWANIPRLLVDPFVLDSRSFAPFRFRQDLARRPSMARAGRCWVLGSNGAENRVKRCENFKIWSEKLVLALIATLFN